MEGLSDEVFRHRFVIQLVDLSQMDATTAAIEGVSGIVKDLRLESLIQTPLR